MKGPAKEGDYQYCCIIHPHEIKEINQSIPHKHAGVVATYIDLFCRQLSEFVNEIYIRTQDVQKERKANFPKYIIKISYT